MKRAAGVLLPISSLPSHSGKGTLGQEAYAFVDFLADAGMRYWQVLPIGPTDETGSPYRSPSAFAGNPDLISPDYKPKAQRSFARFCAGEAHWLDDYARFMAAREPGAPETMWKRQQHRFFSQWDCLKQYANKKGVKLIGDLPFYVSEESVDYLTNPALFQSVRRGARKGLPAAVAGVPPDGFSRKGQIWNDPVYDWKAHAADGYAWWLARLTQASRLYDACRVDHFRGFCAYYAIPFGKAAADGRWRKGPGMDFIGAVRGKLPAFQIIAEDLGMITSDVRALVRESGYPGMAVLQFAFSPKEESTYLPHNHGTHLVVYTGTHDNNTLRGWVAEAPRGEIRKACAYLGCGPEELPAAMMRAALASVANLAILPMQDILGLGAEARLNKPATISDNNWGWQMQPADTRKYKKLAKELRRLNELYGRI